jgi:clan AA aspartic protease
MISGVVTNDLDLLVQLRVIGSSGESVEVGFILDTGFSGAITLPPSLLSDLRLPFHSRARLLLANGSFDRCDVHRGWVLWGESRVEVLVESADVPPLLGMGLVRNHWLEVDAVPGGTVVIRPR